MAITTMQVKPSCLLSTTGGGRSGDYLNCLERPACDSIMNTQSAIFDQCPKCGEVATIVCMRLTGVIKDVKKPAFLRVSVDDSQLSRLFNTLPKKLPVPSWPLSRVQMTQTVCASASTESML
jgi:hypothetical protein